MLDFDWSFRTKAGEFIYLLIYTIMFLLYADEIQYPSKVFKSIYIKLNIHYRLDALVCLHFQIVGMLLTHATYFKMPKFLHLWMNLKMYYFLNVPLSSLF